MEICRYFRRANQAKAETREHRAIEAEIVNADAVQIYKELDIGSAKPPLNIRAEVPHHLIDAYSPNHIYSAGAYIKDAIPIILDIMERGSLPIIVGGTMFYVKALVEGLDPVPSTDHKKLAEFLEPYKELGSEERRIALHKELARIDPKAAKRINHADEQRILRALELNRSSGMNLDELFALMKKDRASTGLRSICQERGWKMHFFAPNYEDRAILRRKLGQRFVEFIQQGLIDEIKQLRNDYPELNLSYPAIRSIGYRQIWEYLDKLEEVDESQALHIREESISEAITATRQFAKRQMTWLRSWQNLNWLDAGAMPADLAKQVISLVSAK